MTRFFQIVLISFLGISTFFSSLSVVGVASAQNVSDFLNLNNPVEYDQTRQIGRARQRPLSIDECLFLKEWSFNEIHNIWVEGLERCKRNEDGNLSRASAQNPTGSLTPADEQACVGRGADQIIKNGAPSESEARKWSDHCSYLGTIGGAGPQTSTGSTSSSYQQYFNSQGGQPVAVTDSQSAPSGSGTSTQALTGSELQQARDDLTNYYNDNFGPNIRGDSYFQQQYEALSGQQRSTFFTQEQISGFNTHFYGSPTGGPSGNDGFTPVYTGVGVQVPDASLAPGGISKETSLINLIVFYTNATLPYVSVISVFVFIAAGMFYILSFTNEDLNAQAKSMMTYVVIGIVIIFSAYTIVNTLLSFSTFAN